MNKIIIFLIIITMVCFTISADKVEYKEKEIELGVMAYFIAGAITTLFSLFVLNKAGIIRNE